jgi:hypothetical protein
MDSGNHTIFTSFGDDRIIQARLAKGTGARKTTTLPGGMVACKTFKAPLPTLLVSTWH